MTIDAGTAGPAFHQHVFLGEGHDRSARKTWAVIWLCSLMMCAEIVGGLLYGSIALVADGLHMSTHAGALLLAALAYKYARRHAEDTDFTFGTGKLGDLTGFTSAIILAMIAILIGYESVIRILAPVHIRFAEAIPIACVGLAVNITSAWLLSRGGHHHGHSHGDAHGDRGHDDGQRIVTSAGELILEIHEQGMPPHFRLGAVDGPVPLAETVVITTERSDGSSQEYRLAARGKFLESIAEIPEPHEFAAHVRIGAETFRADFAEHIHGHGATGRDNNMRAALIHVMADAAVSVLVILGLVLARMFGWLWMDPLAGIIGATVISVWSYGLLRDTGAILLDRIPDHRLARELRQTIESDGSTLADLHLWRLGPGHLGAILSVCPIVPRAAGYYRQRLARFRSLSHLTIEIQEPSHERV
jgi:cation diffusion facilitator family transporter